MYWQLQTCCIYIRKPCVCTILPWQIIDSHTIVLVATMEFHVLNIGLYWQHYQTRRKQITVGHPFAIKRSIIPTSKYLVTGGKPITMKRPMIQSSKYWITTGGKYCVDCNSNSISVLEKLISKPKLVFKDTEVEIGFLELVRGRKQVLALCLLARFSHSRATPIFWFISNSNFPD